MVSPPKQDPVRESEAAITISKAPDEKGPLWKSARPSWIFWTNWLLEPRWKAARRSWTTAALQPLLENVVVHPRPAELEDAFDITIPAVEVVVENFNSVDGLTAMVKRLVEDQLD